MHPIDELPAMLRGELSLDQVRTVTAHLRTCEPCRRELVELAAGAASIARAARHGLLDGVPAPLPPLELPTEDADAESDEELAAAHASESDVRTGRRKRLLTLVAAAALTVVTLVGIIQLRDSSPDGGTASVVLDAIGDSSAQGTVRMRSDGANQVMVVSTNLPPAARDHYYEVWLLDTETNGMVAVGVLPNSGHGEYTLPKELLARYDAIDLSLQPDNGKTVHSSDSVLRAQYT